jgi:hypothetical protein
MTNIKFHFEFYTFIVHIINLHQIAKNKRKYTNRTNFINIRTERKGIDNSFRKLIKAIWRKKKFYDPYFCACKVFGINSQ